RYRVGHPARQVGVELVRLPLAPGKRGLEVLRRVRSIDRGQPEPDGYAAPGRDTESVPDPGFCPDRQRGDRLDAPANHTVMERVLGKGHGARLAEHALAVRLVFAEQERGIAVGTDQVVTERGGIGLDGAVVYASQHRPDAVCPPRPGVSEPDVRN